MSPEQIRELVTSLGIDDYPALQALLFKRLDDAGRGPNVAQTLDK